MALTTSGEKLLVDASWSPSSSFDRDAAVPPTPAPEVCNVANMLEDVDEDASLLPMRSRPERPVSTSVIRLCPRSRSSTPLHVRTTTLGVRWWPWRWWPWMTLTIRPSPVSLGVRSRLMEGRRMHSRRGRSTRNIRWTHGAMVWVDGLRKCTLRTTTVTMMDNDTRTIVKSRYLPMSGTTRDVGGMMSASSRKNTVSDRSIEIHSAIFSPLSTTHTHTHVDQSINQSVSTPHHTTPLQQPTSQLTWFGHYRLAFPLFTEDRGTHSGRCFY